MPFTPESMLTAEQLDCPRVADVYDVIIDTSYVKLINRDTIKEKHFKVNWPGHNHYFVDPVVELFIPLRKKYRGEYDLQIGLDAVHSESSEGILAYRLVCGTFKRKNVNTSAIEDELDIVAPIILAELDELFQIWAEADNGLCLYLEEQNVSSIHHFLESIGLRHDEDTDPKIAKRLAKEKRRQAYLKAHPEHAATARPKKK